MSEQSNIPLTPEQAYERYQAGALMLDVREPDEWAGGHVDKALHIPRGDIENQAATQLADKDAEIITYCKMGGRAGMAAETLRDMGYTNVIPMQGGYADWAEAGYPKKD